MSKYSQKKEQVVRDIYILMLDGGRDDTALQLTEFMWFSKGLARLVGGPYLEYRNLLKVIKFYI